MKKKKYKYRKRGGNSGRRLGLCEIQVGTNWDIWRNGQRKSLVPSCMVLVL